jgi:hypothetical protein
MVSKIGESSDALGLNGPLTNFASQSEMLSASFDFGGRTRLLTSGAWWGKTPPTLMSGQRNPRHMLAAYSPEKKEADFGTREHKKVCCSIFYSSPS